MYRDIKDSYSPVRLRGESETFGNPRPSQFYWEDYQLWAKMRTARSLFIAEAPNHVNAGINRALPQRDDLSVFRGVVPLLRSIDRWEFHEHCAYIRPRANACQHVALRSPPTTRRTVAESAAPSPHIHRTLPDRESS